MVAGEGGTASPSAANASINQFRVCHLLTNDSKLMRDVLLGDALIVSERNKRSNQLPQCCELVILNVSFLIFPVS
jgi:hypothetical protein